MSAPGLAARRGAAALLTGVLDRRASLADQLAAPDGPLARLAPAERARAQGLAAETLRHLGRIDAVLDRFLTRRPPTAAMTLLRIAAAEMLVDGVPAHAAVDGAVRQARTPGRARHLAGLTNAVARRVAAEGAALWAATPEAGPPDWLAARLRAAWGPEAAAAIAAAHAAGRPPVDLTLRDPEADDWAARLGAGRLPTGSLRLAGRPGQVSALPGFAEGAWWVQDAAAALPARLLGDVRGQAVLDICAAPGGKTLQLAAMGARVTALDVSEPRLGRLRDNLRRTGLAAGIVAADALAWAPPAPVAAILLDAPCSATGTLRRHPDLPFVRGEADLAALAVLQARLLARAWDWLAPGGRLVYATCSLLPEEGEAQVDRLAAGRSDVRRLRPDPAALGLEAGWLDAAGGLRLRPDFWPERGGMDGFYVALLEKPAHAA